MSKDEWLVLNVGGKRYEMYLSTLLKSKDSMLARMFCDANRSLLQRSERGEYLIDRNGRAFEGVLEYLRTGQVFLPDGISEEQLMMEFDFFAVPCSLPKLGGLKGYVEQFRVPDRWMQPAQHEFDEVRAEIIDLVRKEAQRGENYSVRIAVLPSSELQRCTGRLGDITRQDVKFAPHPSHTGGSCIVVRQAPSRYLIDLLRHCFERLGFNTSLSMFRYCQCPYCSRKALKTRYITISWNECAGDDDILYTLDRIQSLCETGISVWRMEQ
jgi:BTB/POZ domain